MAVLTIPNKTYQCQVPALRLDSLFSLCIHTPLGTPSDDRFQSAEGLGTGRYLEDSTSQLLSAKTKMVRMRQL